MKLFKNNTPYKGKTKLEVRREPLHEAERSYYSEYIFKFLGFALYTKVDPYIGAHGEEVLSKSFIKEVEEKTNGTINQPDFDHNGRPSYNSFLDKGGNYIGGVSTAILYLKNKFKIEKEYSRKVVECWNEDYSEMLCYAGLGRPGHYVKWEIGQKIFDEQCDLLEEYYEEWQWAGWSQEAEGTGLPISSYVPLNYRGSKTIENLSEAKEAARNYSNYFNK